MDVENVVATMDPADCSFVAEEDNEDAPKPWGRLIPVNDKLFGICKLYDAETSFGRDVDSDYCLIGLGLGAGTSGAKVLEKLPVPVDQVPADAPTREDSDKYRTIDAPGSESDDEETVTVKKPVDEPVAKREETKIADRYFRMYSMKHFRIVKEEATGDVFVLDDSANGTYICNNPFVDGKKVGKGNKIALASGASIALALPCNKVFTFEFADSEYPGLKCAMPKEFTDQFSMTRLLGRGACGEVRLCFSNRDCSRYAVKVIEKRSFSAVDGGSWNPREVEILRTVDHPNIVHFYNMYETPERVFIVMEFVSGGELFDWVKELEEHSANERCELVKMVFCQMALAVKYLHDRDITHRDLKPENILLTGEPGSFIVKITDFGLSKFLTSNTNLKTLCGTPSYVAPEILLSSMGGGSYTKAVDCWSMGVILFILLSGYPPFSPAYQELPMAEQIKTGRYKVYEPQWKDVNVSARKLMEKLILVDPTKRLSVGEILHHPWLNDPSLKEKITALLPSITWPSEKTMDLISNTKRKNADIAVDVEDRKPDLSTFPKPKKSRRDLHKV